jgi:hypothetical protein
MRGDVVQRQTRNPDIQYYFARVRAREISARGSTDPIVLFSFAPASAAAAWLDS